MEKQNFNQGWRFHFGDPPSMSWRAPDDSAWRRVDLPHDWSIERDRSPNHPSKASGGYFEMGRGFYRKTFEALQAWREKKVWIEFEGVYMNAEVWLNEHFLGRYPYGYTSFFYDLTEFLKYGEANVLTVIVDNASQLNSRWYSGSGIYRPVWLMMVDPIHVAHWGVYVTTPEVSAEAARVVVRTLVENESLATGEVHLRTYILGADGAQITQVESTAVLDLAARHEFNQEVSLAHPRLWSPDEPALYLLKTEVVVKGKVLDTVETHFGIRSISFSAERGFLLNGQPLLIKGGCVHHDHGVLGAVSYARAEERKVALHKASGYNAIRCAHNPPAPAFLQACDRLGMMVIDEAFDCWRQGKNPYDYHVVFDDWWRRDLGSMLLRDRNHPCVIAWSIGNEILERDGRSRGVQIARMLGDYVRSVDPSRPVTAAICGSWDERPWTLMDDVFATLDVGGYNYQFRQYEPDHERLPGKVMWGTESVPAEAFDNWMLVLDQNYVIGDFVWTSLDYLGESGIGRVHFQGDQAPFLGDYPWHQANCGDIDLCGFKRPQSYYRDILWQHGEKLYIAVHDPIPEGKTPTITYWGWPEVWPNWNWPGCEGQVFKVDVYSGCEQVELFLNGQSLGQKPTGRAERFMATFEVPYEPGILKAVGSIGGKLVEEKQIQTVGEATQIRLSPDRNILRAEAGDLCYVTVEVLDAQGFVPPSAAHEIFFTVKGCGEIVAVGSSNPLSTERYVGNQRKAYRGRCLVVIKTTGKPGEILLRAQANGLEASETVLRVK